MIVRVVTVALLAVALSSCGQSGAGTQTSYNPSDPNEYSEEDVSHLAGFQRDEYGIAWDGPSGCSVAVILTNKQEIEVYASGGSPVVTNPSGDVGVKYDGSSECETTLTNALANVN